VWAATRSGDDGRTDQPSASADQNAGQGQGEDALGFGNGKQSEPPKKSKSSSAPAEAKEKSGEKQKKGSGQAGTTKPGSTPTTGGGGGSSPEPANKYTPQQVCNSGGHGGGYYVQRSLQVSGGTAYLLYNSSGYNCAVMMKTKNVGTRSTVSVWIQRQGGSQVSDSGSYAWYAGPVYVSAPGKCVRFGSGGVAAPYGNCG
jgi:hypothetical protein